MGMGGEEGGGGEEEKELGFLVIFYFLFSI